MKAIDSMWFNSASGSFGFVIGENESSGERHLYAGVISGIDEEEDKQEILDWGIKVNLAMIDNLLKKCRER